MFRLLICSILFLCFSCQPSSPEDFQMEGVCLMRCLVRKLQGIHTVPELLAAESEMEKIFDKIVDLAIRAAVFGQKHPGAEPVFSIAAKEMSGELLSEMKRIYGIEGGRECMERAQREPMLRLHAKELLLRKKQAQTFN